jgi:mono/diheme cytochrome c family protein
VKHLKTFAVTGSACLVAGLAVGAPARAAAPADGEATFQKWCAPCHDAGPLRAGTAGLANKYKGTSENPVLAERTNLTPDFVRATVRIGVNAMPPFRRTEISNSELDALAQWLSAKNPNLK